MDVKGHVRTTTAPSLVGLLLAWVACAPAAEPPAREPFLDALLKRSRFLEDVRFRVPVKTYRAHLRDLRDRGPATGRPPIHWLPREGAYHLAVAADGSAALTASVSVRVFRARRARGLRLLSARLAWEQVRVDGKAAKLPTRDGWLRFTPPAAGPFTLSARAHLPKPDAARGTLVLDVPATVVTSVRFDSDRAWDVTVAGAAGGITGEEGRGTHGRAAVPPRARIEVRYAPRVVLPPRPPRYEVRGAVAWNLDAGRQQVAAQLDVRIVGGRTDRLDLRLPAGARNVSITGPDVREARRVGDAAVVHLRGRIAGQTRLRIAWEAPWGAGSVKRLQRIDLADGRWVGGTLAVTNTVGGSEVLAQSVRGLREMHPADLPPEVKAILLGKPVLAYEITSRSFEAAVDVVDLGELALRESIADLAHFQLTFCGDGSAICKVKYEIRNRNRQYLRVTLPAGSHALAVRVNDKPRPLAPVTGQHDVYLLPLVRSQASVKGLVSFPVELVILFRGQPLRAGRGAAALPLPRIDLPIAYGWCEVRVPDDLHVRQWSGPLRHVRRYSSETAVASLTYGRGEMAEGYTDKDRPTTALRAASEDDERSKPADTSTQTSPTAAEKAPPVAATPKAIPPDDLPEAPVPTTRPAVPQQTLPIQLPGADLAQGLLARNYYRAGRDFYEQGRYNEAVSSLTKAVELAPRGSPEAPNAERLLANILVVRGKAEKGGRAEKALGRQVKQETSRLNVELEARQRRLLEEGEQAVRGGHLSDAQTQFEAAEALGKQLVEQGADKSEQTVRLREARKYLSRFRKQQAEQAAELREKYKALKSKGDKDAAFQVGKALQALDVADKDQLRGELEDLAVALVQEHDRANTDKDAADPPVARRKPPLGRWQIDWSLPDSQIGKNIGLDVTTDRPARQEGTRTARGRTSIAGGGRAGGPAVAEVRVYTLKHAAAENLQRVLRDVMAGAGDGICIEADKESNVLFVHAPEEKLKRIDTLIAKFDITAMSVPRVASGSVPGPEASRGTEAQAGTLSRLSRRNAVARRAAEAEIHEARRRSAESLAAASKPTDFDRAEVAARTAHDALSAGESFLPADEYQRTKARIEGQLQRIATHRDEWHRERAASKAAEIERVQTQRRLEDTSRRDERIAALTKQAEAHRSRRDYEKALEAVRQVKALDPHNTWAERQTDVLLELDLLARTRDEMIASDGVDRRPAGRGESQAEVPWYQLLRYPKNWERLTEDRKELTASAAGESPADAAIRQKLARTIERLNFTDIDLKDVIQFLREYSDTNIHVNWRALEDAGIETTTKIAMDTRNVTVRRALEMVLREAAGAAAGTRAALGYGIDGGVLVVSTKADFQREPIRRVYDVRDLLVDVPTFKGPRIELSEATGGEDDDEDAPADVGGIFEDFGEAFGSKSGRRREQLTEDLVERIKAGIGRDSWADSSAGGDAAGAIQIINGQLVVTQTATNHETLSRMIEDLRRARGRDSAGEHRYAAEPDLPESRPVQRKTYDVRDLVYGGGAQTDDGKTAAEGVKTAEALVQTLRGTLGGGGGGVGYENGRLVVTGSAAEQKVAGTLLDRLRDVRGPQVQVGANIVGQRAAGLVDGGDGVDGFAGDVQADSLFDATSVVTAQDVLSQRRAREIARRSDFQDFLTRNYEWRFTAPLPDGRRILVTQDVLGDQMALSEKLLSNLGQKVGVNSLNINVGAGDAAALGVEFTDGANDTSFAVVDEAQLRTLRDVEARRDAREQVVRPNLRFQETIVGTDALLASGQVTNVIFASDGANRLELYGNRIDLPHEKYVLIDNHGYLTAVRAGEMHHWTQPVRPIEFAEVPQDIDVPQVGRLEKFEKTLIRPTDELTIQATYTWEGDGQ